MADLHISTGVVTYTLNDSVSVSFNPTDSAFVEKLFHTFDTLDQKQAAYKEEIDRMTDRSKIFEFARSRDAEMREMIDSVFDTPVCAALFGDMNVYAMADGLPVWCNLMLAIMDEIDTSFAREQKLTNPRIAKYTEKYKKQPAH